MSDRPGLLMIGHGSRADLGVSQYWALAEMVAELAPELRLGCGFIELAPPNLHDAIDALASEDVSSVVAVPLVLLGAGHLKDDGPAALAAARRRHPRVGFTYARDLGIHPLVLSVAEERVASSLWEPVRSSDAVILVGRGSTDPDANADLYKVTRLVSESELLPTMVEPAFVSLARPGVAEALERCRRLGARRVAVVPYFLFTGILVERIRAQTRAWAAEHSDVAVTVGREMGPDARIAHLVVDRYHQARAGDARMNCDCCTHRAPLLGHPRRHHHLPVASS